MPSRTSGGAPPRGNSSHAGPGGSPTRRRDGPRLRVAARERRRVDVGSRRVRHERASAPCAASIRARSRFGSPPSAPPTSMPRQLSVKEARRVDRATRLALLAAEEAIADAALDLDAAAAERVGVVIGSSIGGIETLLEGHDVLRERGARRLSPFLVPMTLPNMTAGFVSMQWGFRGPIACPVGACASGAQALGAAARLIERGDADVVIAGGTDAAVLPLVMAGFAAMRALSTRNDDPTRASRPFDRDRDGFVIGEGAGILVLESEAFARARRAPLRAVLLGYGEASDAAHPATPPADASRRAPRDRARARRRRSRAARRRPRERPRDQYTIRRSQRGAGAARGLRIARRRAAGLGDQVDDGTPARRHGRSRSDLQRASARDRSAAADAESRSTGSRMRYRPRRAQGAAGTRLAWCFRTRSASAA